MKYPSLLQPHSIEQFSFGNATYEIPTKRLKFKKWTGAALKNSFGSKPLIDFDGNPVFAEIAILKLGEISGWNGRWIGTYGMKKNNPYLLKNWKDAALGNQESIEIENPNAKKLLEQLMIKNNGYAGCWDVFLWNKDHFVFYESKKSSKDSIRNTQVNWFNNALDAGLIKDNFVIITWDFED